MRFLAYSGTYKVAELHCVVKAEIVVLRESLMQDSSRDCDAFWTGNAVNATTSVDFISLSYVSVTT